ncbi:MAG TPA: TIGR03086 family metal-binding protein [Ilumatobacteraceae bacterium]|nr:TIGR03086 family metal-binding protein [Ilumatobacteraceae bacterium]
MTTQTLHPSATTSTIDPRPLFAAAIEIATPVIAGVRPDQLDLQSPCVEFDVKGVLAHLVFVLHRVAKISRGEEAFSPGSMADDVVEHLDWAADWQAGAAEVHVAIADDSLLQRTVVLPWATLTGAEMLAIYTSEVTTHTWDVAKATGQLPEWDDAVCQLALQAMHRSLPIAERGPIWEAFRANAPANMQFDPPFANAVAVSSNAPAIEQLVAWAGRQP